MEVATEAFLELLYDETFRRLYRTVDDELLSWTRFQKLTMPEGYTARDIWRILSALRRMKSHVFPLRPYTHAELPEETWCSIDNHIGILLQEIVDMASNEAVKGVVRNQYRYLQSLSQDTSAALARDGIVLDPETIHGLATRQLQPVNSEQQLAMRVVDLVMSVGEQSKYPFTPWMLEDFLARAGVKEAALVEGTQSAQPAYVFGSQSSQQVIQTLFDEINKSDESLELFVLDVLAMSVALWDLVPFPRWNGLIELFMRNWAFEHVDLTALRAVPFSHLCRRWELGDVEALQVKDSYFDVNPDFGEAHDATSFFGNALRIVADALRAERVTMDDNDPIVSSVLEASSELNARQRDVFRSLTLDPMRQTTIALHMSLFRVSYGTARSDLLGLVESGLLEQDYQSRAMVFRVKRDQG